MAKTAVETQENRRTRAQMLEETREQLLTAGRNHFGDTGYAATAMDDLTASAGLTRGALYHHFGGKQGLMEAVVRQLDAEICVQLKAILRDNEDPIIALAERGRAYIQLTQAAEFQRIMFTDAPAVVPDAVEETAADCIATLAEVVERGRASGVIPAEASPIATATMLNGALADASRWVAAASPEQREERLAQAISAATSLVEGLRVRD